MGYLLLSILSSAAVTLLLRLFSSRQGNRFGLLPGNYLVCALLAFCLLSDRSEVLRGSPVTWLCGVAGGFLFVGGLICMQSSVRRSGAALTAAFAKLGLLVPLIISTVWFHERPGKVQLLGIGLALTAILILNGRREPGDASPAPSLLLPLMTLLLVGASDGMSKVFERLGSRAEDALYFLYVFTVAALLAGLLVLLEKRRSGRGLTWGDLGRGAAVGVPNYFSSYWLLLSLERLEAVLVFPAFSVGTILTVTVLGALLFHERLGRRQLWGLGCILIALVLLNL